MTLENHNLKNPALKRILQELKELQDNPSDAFMSLPLEDNMFEWQFAIRGASDTEFEGGIYHGRIQLPAEYPLRPPSFVLLTPNGRFETQTKICLSISNHHPEHWQPSWSVRTALVALIAFMPTEPGGALGSLDYPKEERRALAIKSREAPPKFGNSERQMLINEIHQYMLSKVPPVPQPPPQPLVEHSSNRESEALQLHHQNGIAGAENRVRLVEDIRVINWHVRVGRLRFGINARFRNVRRADEDPSDRSRHPIIARLSNVLNDRNLTYAAAAL
ncbi:Ubiquitin-conjugating enzyme E2 32, partial [Sarracenia purpurea var. burkii]